MPEGPLEGPLLRVCAPPPTKPDPVLARVLVSVSVSVSVCVCVCVCVLAA